MSATKHPTLYALECEDLTDVGGPIWTKYFTSLEKAKHYAEKHWKKINPNGDYIKWSRGKNHCHSQDLLCCMYNIEKLKVKA